MSARAAGEKPSRPISVRAPPGDVDDTAVAANSDFPPPARPTPKPRSYALQPPPAQHPPAQYQPPPPVQQRQPPQMREQPPPVQHQPPPPMRHQQPPLVWQQPPPLQHQPPPPVQQNLAYLQPPAAAHYAAQQLPPYNTAQQYLMQPQPVPGQQPAVAANGGNAGSTAKKNRPSHVQLQIGYNICTYWQGILEIIGRSIAMVVALIVLANAAVAISTIDNNNTLSVIDGLDSSLASSLLLDELQGVIKNTKGICGFLIFVAVVALLVEALTIIVRFTTSLSKLSLRIFHIVDAVASGLVGLMFLAGTIGSATLSAKWNEPPLGCDSDSNPCDHELLGRYTSVIASAGFVAVVSMVFLAVWSILNIIKKWDTKKSSENQQAE